MRLTAFAARGGDRTMPGRGGITLPEVLVVIGIIAIVMALVFPAVQLVRNSAANAQCSNQLRNIGLALHHYAHEHNQTLPHLFSNHAPNPAIGSITMGVALLPYLEHGNYYKELIAGQRSYGNDYCISIYVCPLDPVGNPDRQGNMSYAANAQVFCTSRTVRSIILDGKSYTVAFAEHYSNTPRCKFEWGFNVIWEFEVGSAKFTMRRASFADFIPGSRPYDPLRDDVYPVTSGNPPVSRGSIPELTFQVRPRLEEADPRIPQTGHPGGMPLLMLDGRVITMRKGTAPEVFWSLVTPRGGEAVELPD